MTGVETFYEFINLQSPIKLKPPDAVRKVYPMKRYGVMVILVLVAGLIMFPFHSISESNNSEKPEKGVGQNEPAEKDDQSKIQVRGKTAFRFFTYKPPKRGMPGGRIGGGTRGKTDGYPILTVLAPDHTGLTTKTRPVLYWYLSTATPKQIEFTLILAREGKNSRSRNNPCRGRRGNKAPQVV